MPSNHPRSDPSQSTCRELHLPAVNQNQNQTMAPITGSTSATFPRVRWCYIPTAPNSMVENVGRHGSSNDKTTTSSTPN